MAVPWTFYISTTRIDNHPGACAPPLLNQEGSPYKLPSSDEEGRRLWRRGGAEPEV
jgi:hypothetical protein